MKSWKTTAAGIAAFFAVASPEAVKFFDNDPATVPQWELVIGAAIVAVGLLFAKDSNVTGAGSSAHIVK